MTQTEDIPLSTNVKVKATFYQEPAHTPFDPTAVTVQAMKPDGTVVTGLTAAHEGTGIYSAVIFTDQPGRWYYVFKGTGALVAGVPGSFDVSRDNIPVETSSTAVLTIRDIENYMGRVLEASEYAGASQLIMDVQAQLEGWLGRSLLVAAHTETLPVYPQDNFIELSYTPVQTVTAITVDGVNWITGSWALDRSGVHLISGAYIASNFTTLPSSAVVAYTGGLGEPAVSQARLALKGRTQRIIDKRKADELGLKSLRIDLYSTDWLDEDFFTENELKSVERWQRRGVSMSPAPPPYYDPWTTGVQ